uniref:Uncharacterized protein n=1 Tax=Kalmanozyma brasiliensis (strain GHG001) TaxID=1365824 RepID=V5EUG3_KALBG
MAESLSNFTPPAWEKNYNSRMALFKRLAGVSKDEIFETEKANMAHQVAKAHARMQPRSPTSPRKGRAAEQQKAASPRKNRIKEAAALASSPQKQAASRQIEAVLRSPRTNRRIYALETQLGGGSLAESPISLAPSLTGGADRFGQIVAALKKGERRQNNGMQLNLNSFVSSSKVKAEPSEARREGLSEDLEDVLSDDDDDSGDTTVTNLISSYAGGDAETDETQPLPWDSSPTQLEPALIRPRILPLQSAGSSPLRASQRTTASSTSSSSSGIIPSQTNLNAEGNTQLRTFFHDL